MHTHSATHIHQVHSVLTLVDTRHSNVDGLISIHRTADFRESVQQARCLAELAHAIERRYHQTWQLDDANEMVVLYRQAMKQFFDSRGDAGIDEISADAEWSEGADTHL